jgi:hypothetical protein
LYTATFLASPDVGIVSECIADIATHNKVVDITTHTPRTVIDWRSFDIAADEITNIQQPSSASLVLNRVHIHHSSVIAGGNGKSLRK